jgi:DNA topoisomerase III
MVSSLVIQVAQENSNGLPGQQSAAKASLKCPKCKTAELVRGKTAVGCKNFKVCGFKMPFQISGLELNDKQIMAFLETGSLKVKKDNLWETLVYTNDFEVVFSTGAAKEPKKVKEPKVKVEKVEKKQTDFTGMTCPKCNSIGLIKGNTAYGCSNWKNGCDFRIPLD